MISRHRCRHKSRLMVVLALASVGVFVRAQTAAAWPGSGGQNRIQAENAATGTDAWMIADKRDSPPCPQSSLPMAKTPCIEGYANLTSVNAGNSIKFFVNVVPVVPYSLDVFRMGWYGGKGGRLMVHAAHVHGKVQVSCPVNQSLRMVSCSNWISSYTLSVPLTWTSGVYLVLLTRSDGKQYQSYISFVVRGDSVRSVILFQSSVTTYQAYNYWGSRSLYKDKHYGDQDPRSYLHRAYAVSFDRPNVRGFGAGDFLFWEYPMVRWLERKGLDVAYQTDIDTDVAGGSLLRHRAFISVGHDEYWSKAMRDSVERALQARVSLGFFGANAAYWQVRFEPSRNGAPRRVMVCYKFDAKPGDTKDPLYGHQNSLVTVQWRQALTKLPSPPRVARPEQALIGQMSEGQVNAPGYALRITNTGTWPFQGTGLHGGDTVKGIVGYEYDNIHLPKPAGETILAASPVVRLNDGTSVSNVTLYTAPSGGRVFAAGTIQWSWGLDNDAINAGDRNRDHHQVASAALQRLTANVLSAFTS